MKILIDTNLLIDYFSKRPLFFADARTILKLCMEQQIDGCIAAHSIMNVFYILRKELTLEERRSILLDLCKIVSVIGIDQTKLVAALENEDFTDVEDCLQMECAKEFAADYIVTRNIKDFQHSVIPPILPKDFLEKVGKCADAAL